MSSAPTARAAPGVRLGLGRIGARDRSAWTGAEGAVGAGGMEGGADAGPDAGDGPRHPAESTAKLRRTSVKLRIGYSLMCPWRGPVAAPIEMRVCQYKTRLRGLR